MVLGCAIYTAANAQPAIACPTAISNIAAGNADALTFFQQRVVKRADVGTAARSRPDGFDTPEAHGARGDGVTDDTRALQGALASGKGVWLASGHVYRFTRRLRLGSGATLSSDGSATLLMSAGPGAFDNQVARRVDAALYSENGVGIRVEGQNINISDLFLVKEYADGRYVIGIDVVDAAKVSIRRVRLRGFSLAPGIVTIRSSDNVEFSSSLIHASCTQFLEIPADIATFQITGISIDDSRVRGRASTNLRLHNNVIDDVRMIPLTTRREQSDGINFASGGVGLGSVVSDNFISGVDEALDLFGAGINVRGNRLAATGTVLKLIHGARDIFVRGNEITPGPNAKAIGLYRANPPELARQVRDIVIERNQINLDATQSRGVVVDLAGELLPTGITLRQNKFLVSQCQQQTIRCNQQQCIEENNEKVRSRGGQAC